jgi:4,5:9,10-diseco-3-hydroxy-5,9,17-trioxoandrosta-1(10),2-diene-4-oate hydrolase
MNALDLEKTDLVGLSLGGGIALNFSLRYPKRLGRLVLVDSVGLGKEAPKLFRLPTLPLIGEWLTRPSRQRTREMFELGFYDPDNVTSEMVEFYYELSTQPGAQQAFLATLRALGSLSGLRDMVLDSFLRGLKRLDASTLIIWGRQDEFFPVEQARSAHKNLPDSRLEIIDECGHLPPMEKPEQFNQIVLDFLRDGGSN